MKYLKQMICGLLMLALPALSQAQPHYKIGISDSFQPFNYRGANGELKGFNVDIARALCKQMQAKCEFVVTPFPKVIPALEKGLIDFATSNFLITDERAKRINFSAKYYRSTTSLIGPIDSPHQTPDEILQDGSVVIATQQSSAQASYLHAHSQARIIEIKSIGAGLELLRQQEVDYLIAPTLFALNFLQKSKNANLDFIGNPINHPSLSGSVHIGISKQQPQLKAEMDQALSTLLDNGQLRAIINQYFPFDVY